MHICLSLAACGGDLGLDISSKGQFSSSLICIKGFSSELYGSWCYQVCHVYVSQFQALHQFSLWIAAVFLAEGPFSL